MCVAGVAGGGRTGGTAGGGISDASAAVPDSSRRLIRYCSESETETLVGLGWIMDGGEPMVESSRDDEVLSN